MLRAILNKSWQQHPTRHQLYGHLPPITKTIQVRRTRHAGHCWRSRDELIRDVLLWIPTHGRAKAGWPARTYIQQLCEDIGCCPEDLPRAMNDREEWRERVRDIRATSAIWWWWYSARITKEKILDLGWSVLLHPPYSPDLTPSDFHLFYSQQLNDKHLSQEDQVKTFEENFLSSKPVEFYMGGINKLPDNWQKASQNNDKYTIDRNWLIVKSFMDRLYFT